MRASALLIPLAVVVAACGGDTAVEESVGFGPGAESPQDAVNELVEHLDRAEFKEASDLSVPGHAALASLAEGASFLDVAAAIRQEDTSVAANFWAGFAQGSATFLSGDVATADGEAVVQDSLELQSVPVIADDGAQRTMFTQEVDGWRIDVFASFGGGLAGRMIAPAERLLVTETDDAALILQELRAVVPSLLVAAVSPDLPPQLSQDVLRLIEVISRSS
ncbi:MAG: hypothetical protein U9N56_05985 [Actinomycetota bacterium]|nr:hypothetical protein [Actinomycetota bacterium]